jgi:SAM-dependent methyltransferase
MPDSSIKDVVREKYAEAAIKAGSGGSCGCGTSCCSTEGTAKNPVTSDLYSAIEAGSLPEKAVLASLGCGNPTALAELKAGEVVLDLGSGGGIDVLLSAKRVGLTGKAYGLDMTDEMLALARENQRQAGAENVEFLKGEIPTPIRRDVLAWAGCIAGALDENDYRAKLAAAGFVDIEVEPTRIYRAEDARGFLVNKDLDVDALAAQVDGKIFSAFVRATKPGTV